MRGSADLRVDQDETGTRMSAAVAEAIRERAGGGGEPRGGKSRDRRRLTWSTARVLRGMDFEKMTGRGDGAPRRAHRPHAPADHARSRPAAFGPIRPARGSTCAASCAPPALGGDPSPCAAATPRRRHPPLVILCDISGSMSRYSRMLLHFMHAITNDRDRVHTFLFGTRLTNITRHLRHRDVDWRSDRSATRRRTGPAAPASASACTTSTALVAPGAGPGRRVLLISDGLDRDAGAGLGAEMRAAAQILPPADLAESPVAL